MVAYNMCQWKTFVSLVKTAPKSDIAVLVITFLLTIIFDLVVAIEIGMLLACLLFMKRMSDVTEARSWVYTEDEQEAEREKLRHLPAHVHVYELTGPLFFGAAGVIGQIAVHDGVRCLILRMRSVPALDATAMNAMIELQKKCAAKGICLILSHVNEQPYNVMQKAGFIETVGAENFAANIDAAIERAESILQA
jgi:SulP family sulfate permease